MVPEVIKKYQADNPPLPDGTRLLLFIFLLSLVFVFRIGSHRVGRCRYSSVGRSCGVICEAETPPEATQEEALSR